MGHFQLFQLLCLVWSLFICGSHQLQSSQTQVLLQLRKHLEYPAPLEVWNDGHGIDFCYLAPSQSLNLTCQNNLITELILVGDKKSSTKLSSFQGNAVPGLTLSQNFSMDSFVTTLARLNTLRVLKLVSLGIWGPLPDKIKRLTSLECLDLSDNFLYGSVPAKISAMSSLQILVLDDNFFNGTIPDGLGALQNLTVLSLRNNRLGGRSPDLSGIHNLQVLNLSMNRISSSLPGLPKSLVMAFLNNNSFSGEIPKQYGQLTHLQYLDVSFNMLRGSPPSGLFSLANISYINLASNSLVSMPVHSSCSKNLWFVDLSNNRLSGDLPPCLDSHSGSRTVIYDGNCLSPVENNQNQHNESYCSEVRATNPSRRKNVGVLVAAIIGCVAVLCLMAYSLLVFMRCCSRGISEQHLLRKSIENDNSASRFSSEVFTSARYFSEVDKFNTQGPPPCRAFSLEELKEATNDFDKTAFISEGSYGKLYKGRLQNGTQVAVRCLPSSKRYSIRNLRLRLDLLSKLRHPHLVCLLGHCIDGGGQEDPRSDRVFLIYEFVPNGSFQAHLSGNNPAEALSWSERLRVLIGVARAVHFLHTGIIPGFFSNRLKINNILLNEHRVAKLSDYGLSVISGEIDKNTAGEGPRRSWHAKSLEDDGYSFGFIILESFAPSVSTRRESFMLNELDILSSTEGWPQVVDPYVLATCTQESLKIVISLAKKCISFDGSRPSFEDILWNLQYAAQVQATADGQ